MDKSSSKALIFNPKYLSINHQSLELKSSSGSSKKKEIIKDDDEQKLLEFISDTNKFKIDSNFDHKNMMNILLSKYEAMKKLDLNDELIDDLDENCKTKTRKINIDKKIFPKSLEKNIYKNYKSDKTIHIRKHEKQHHDSSIDKFIQKESQKSLNHFINKNFDHHHKKKDKKKKDLFKKIETIKNNESNTGYNDSKKRVFSHFFSDTQLIYSILQEMNKNHCK